MRFNLLPPEITFDGSTSPEEVTRIVQQAGGRVIVSRRSGVVVDGELDVVNTIMPRIRGWVVEGSQRSSTNSALDGILEYKRKFG